MDAFVDSVTWHHSVFVRSGSGETWRVWYNGDQPFTERLIGNEPEYFEPLSLLQKRAMEKLTGGRS